MVSAKSLHVALVVLSHLLILVTGVEEDVIRDCDAAMPSCDCYDLGPIIGLLCENGSFFSGPLNALDEKYGTITYEIGVMGHRIIPPGFLDKLIVYQLFIDDVETSEVSVDAFNNVNRLRKFHVFKSSIRVIPNFADIPHSLRKINIDNSLLTEVKGEFQKLPLLTLLSLSGNLITSVAADAFQGSPILEVLDLSYNRITSLPESLLQGQADLKKIALSNNRLHTVHGLFRNIAPKFITLGNNNLTDADDIFYPNMTSVQSVELSYNPLGRLSPHSFNHKTPNVRYIYLDCCEIVDFKYDYFKYLNELRTLTMLGNRIRRVENDTFNFVNAISLDLSFNEIESFTSNITFKIIELFVFSNKLSRIDTFLQNTQMRGVYMADNNLEALHEQDFHGVHNTVNLDFRGNSIQSIEKDCFRNLRNDLQYLDLSSNRLKSLNESIQYLSVLTSLNISHNSLYYFGDMEFAGLNDLSELYLQHNKIVELTGELQVIPKLQYLIIQNNRIRTIYPSQVPALQYLYLKDNPLVCDCRLEPFLNRLQSSDAPGLDTTVCAVPEDPSTEEETSLKCPSSCSCDCLQDADGESYISLNCRSRQLSSLPSIFIDNTTSARLPTSDIYVQASLQNFSVSDRIRSVDLGNNRIESLKDVGFPPSLKTLYLANNLLKDPPYVITELPKLRNLSLGDNPWSCDCNDRRIVKFKNWVLSKRDNILDVNNTRCYSSHQSPELKNKILISLSDIDLCPSDNVLYFAVAFSMLSVLLLCAALKITYSRFEMNIKVWLYSHGVSWVKEKDIDQDKMFDAFISFSHQDHTFVTNEIIEEIERRCPTIRLCIHYRNFLPGEFIHDNIINAVSNSKRTVLILSKNFLESEWCLMEFRAAHLQALKDKVHRVIVIKVEELPEELVDSAIKVYLDTTTYVTWGEKYFWQNLLYSLPTPGVYASSSTII